MITHNHGACSQNACKRAARQLHAGMQPPSCKHACSRYACSPRSCSQPATLQRANMQRDGSKTCCLITTTKIEQITNQARHDKDKDNRVKQFTRAPLTLWVYTLRIITPRRPLNSLCYIRVSFSNSVTSRVREWVHSRLGMYGVRVK